MLMQSWSSLFGTKKASQPIQCAPPPIYQRLNRRWAAEARITIRTTSLKALMNQAWHPQHFKRRG